MTSGDAIELHPVLLHSLHTRSAAGPSQYDSCPQDTNTKTALLAEFPVQWPPGSLRRPTAVYSAKGSILHIRRVSRHTTFVDINIRASCVWRRNPAGIPALKTGGLEACSVRSSDESFESRPAGADVKYQESPQRQADLRTNESRNEGANCGKHLENGFPADTSECLVRESEGPVEKTECTACARLELFIPSAVLATLPQKLRIGSFVECRGEHLENLAARPSIAGPRNAHQGGKDKTPILIASQSEEAAEGEQIGAESDCPAFLSKQLRIGCADEEANDGDGGGATGSLKKASIQAAGSVSWEGMAVTSGEKVSITQDFVRHPEAGQPAANQAGLGSEVDWMLKVSSLTVFDPRGSASGNEFLDKSRAVKSMLPTKCHRSKRSAPKPGVCKYWVNEGRCARGYDCVYDHPAHGEALRKARAAYLQAKAAGDHSHGNAGKAKRAQVFGDWVWETYGKELGGLTVMDIAAGAHGELAFHLAVSCSFLPSVLPLCFWEDRCRDGVSLL
jgi:hypothetical protein